MVERVSVVVLGGVSQGKSSLVGQLCLTINGSTCDSFYPTIVTSQHPNELYPISFLSDTLPMERERRQSFVPSHLVANNVSPKFSFTIIDVPGRIKATKATIAAITQAHVAILVISALDFENEMKPHTGTSWQHLIYASVFGIQQIIVCVNKLDHPSVAYSQATYSAVVSLVTQTLVNFGFKKNQRQFVPISALRGYNLFHSYPDLSWSSVTLLDALEDIEIRRCDEHGPFKLIVGEMYKISGIGTVALGSILSGSLTPDIELTIRPIQETQRFRSEPKYSKNVMIRSIERHHEYMNVARVGDYIGVNIRYIAVRELKAGMVLSEIGAPCELVTKCIALISILWHPTSFQQGYAPTFYFGTTRIPCSITRIIDRIDRKTKKVVKKRRIGLIAGDLARVEITLRSVQVLEPFAVSKILGSLIIRDHNRIVAVGKIEQINPRDINPLFDGDDYEDESFKAPPGTGRMTKAAK